tara:strand:+ start:680 stop:976 length:297 start_codon:yes stop_codon:yes gene_type:complete
MQNKTHFFNLIRFYKWGIGLNTWKIINRLSQFIIRKRIKSLDNFFKKRSVCYGETLRDFYDPAPPYYDRNKMTGKMLPRGYWEGEKINPTPPYNADEE